MASQRDLLVGRAEEWLGVAKDACEGRHYNAAYELARTAAEPASKALLIQKTGAYAKEHNVAGPLSHHRLIPEPLSASAVSRLLGDFSRGSYGFDEPVTRVEAKNASGSLPGWSQPATRATRRSPEPRSACPYRFAVNAWWIIIRTWRDIQPFTFFVLPGVVFLLASLAFALNAAVHLYLTGGITGRVGSLITSGVLLLFGFHLLMIGLMADMIRKHSQHCRGALSLVPSKVH